jgi:hypothetical protein
MFPTLAISLLRLACIIVYMDSRIGVRCFYRILKMIVRRASPPVGAYEGSCYA